MYNRRNIIRWSLVIVLIVLVFWQVWLIIITVYNLLLGISDNTSFHPMNLSHPKIPPIIHQIWKTTNLSSYPISASYVKWQKMYPDYTVRLWTDVDLVQLISSKEYSYLLETYRSYPFDIQRADLARLIVLHYQGGIYADLDVFPRNRSIKKLRSSGASFIIPRSSSDSTLINHILISEQHSKVVDYLLHNASPILFYQRIFLIPYLQVFSTGSVFLTRTLEQWMKSPLHENNLLWILSSKQISSYVGHDAGRSWHSFDGYFFNFISDLPEIS
ncbi:unnamed protein product [Adineta steineri]|uniref:Uncharacterized protein n=1 Tax=Adineta steineri TaxID=433720 RepID=A0A813MW93_9BILA|nr:unnamed protein product [Adineta steineri]